MPYSVYMNNKNPLARSRRSSNHLADFIAIKEVFEMSPYEISLSHDIYGTFCQSGGLTLTRFKDKFELKINQQADNKPSEASVIINRADLNSILIMIMHHKRKSGEQSPLELTNHQLFLSFATANQKGIYGYLTLALTRNDRHPIKEAQYMFTSSTWPEFEALVKKAMAASD